MCARPLAVIEEEEDIIHVLYCSVLTYITLIIQLDFCEKVPTEK
jgi:hypothetical protein